MACPSKNSTSDNRKTPETTPDTRELLEGTLKKDGWQVLTANNGRLALDRIAGATPGLILLDLMMPEMDGFTFLDELRRRPEGRGIPVIVQTAKDLNAEERHKLSQSVEKVLRKGKAGRRSFEKFEIWWRRE